MKKLNELGEVTDIYYSTWKNHPVTYGENGDNFPLNDKVLTAKEDFGSELSLDYIFEIKKETKVNNN